MGNGNHNIRSKYLHWGEYEMVCVCVCMLVCVLVYVLVCMNMCEFVLVRILVCECVIWYMGVDNMYLDL